MLDQQTKTQLKDKFQQLKPQLKQQFSGLTDEDLQSGQSDPDQLVQTISQKTGQPSSQIEQQLKTLVQSS